MRIILFWVAVFFLSFTGTMLQGQTIVSGLVKDIITGDPVMGANILIPDQKKGTSTNDLGQFKFESLPSGDYVLSISHIRYIDKKIIIHSSENKPLIINLEPDSVQIASFVVTATRTERLIEEIPQRVDKISRVKIESYPASNTDNLLKMVPGVVVNRSWGIFSRNAAVTMRGLPGSQRSLILLDGVPLNKTAGGTVNWHLVSPDEIESIEVVKGPGSSLYGMNAMSGVINIITKKPGDKIQGMLNIGYGSFNTIKTQVNLSGRSLKDNKGLYWKFGGFYRQGDGYILEPDETKDSLSVNAYLFEGNINALLGYQFGKNTKLELDYRYYHDMRGNGVKVYQENGSYESFTDHNLRLGYEQKFGKYNLNIKSFYLTELFGRQNEKINSSGEYKLVDTDTDKRDMGVWMTLSRDLTRNQNLTFGVDIKNGTLDNQEVYRTSTDQLYTDGKLIFTGLFAQDEISLLQSKLKLVAGLRMDVAQFYDGHLEVLEPTSQTGFPESTTQEFENSSWMQISPKLAARYYFRENLDAYTSISYGFMPPKLDDLVGSRKIRRGFKIANPELTPEQLLSFEVGANYSLKKKLVVKPSSFYSRGNDFQYLMVTGDFVDEDSEEPVPVYQRQNVSKVDAMGAELGLEYDIISSIKLTASYAYNYSKIIEYSASDDLDLAGKYLNEVPQNLLFVGFQWRNKIVNVFADYTFTDDQWYDEENTVIIEGYSLINIRFFKNIGPNFQLLLDVQDLLDDQFVDRKGYMSPGRFIMFEVKYFINRNRKN